MEIIQNCIIIKENALALMKFSALTGSITSKGTIKATCIQYSKFCIVTAGTATFSKIYVSGQSHHGHLRATKLTD